MEYEKKFLASIMQEYLEMPIMPLISVVFCLFKTDFKDISLKSNKMWDLTFTVKIDDETTYNVVTIMSVRETFRKEGPNITVSLNIPFMFDHSRMIRKAFIENLEVFEKFIPPFERICIYSSNLDKIKLYKEVLAPLNIEIISKSFESSEPQDTVVSIAKSKFKKVCNNTIISVVDDTSLSVGETNYPGILTKFVNNKSIYKMYCNLGKPKCYYKKVVVVGTMNENKTFLFNIECGMQDSEGTLQDYLIYKDKVLSEHESNALEMDVIRHYVDDFRLN
jgi:hypothetical protein